MRLETERLFMRLWKDGDAEDLYRYASDPAVGPIAGWPPHRNVEESLTIIRTVLAGPEDYAICLKESDRPIGCISLNLAGHTDKTNEPDECEMGYWLGKPFWGRGLMPEAVREMQRHAFEDCGMNRIWIGYYDGNERSRRVQEKCGFVYQWTTPNVEVSLMHETRIDHVSSLTRTEWEQTRQG